MNSSRSTAAPLGEHLAALSAFVISQVPFKSPTADVLRLEQTRNPTPDRLANSASKTHTWQAASFATRFPPGSRDADVHQSRRGGARLGHVGSKGIPGAVREIVTVAVRAGYCERQVSDGRHIMEHLDGVIDKPESEMTPQELQLHYFKMHDYDGNNLLDGLELISAIAHVHKEESGGQGQPMGEEEIVSLIDDILRDDDKNNDGYIDYAEFAKSLE
ncbi:uncharacterized protein LOC132402763 isoform X2 [Hypanus sabinus]|uniref:uncharacterized protein LOC132402763 isoform X2 n=1 Tax=Hypanus sabinus TaxID=79690 RepID=UPI0028C400BF|nr:uncharacterized protein LOC132402763 isoform X2 [Hypanus sabinus]